MSGAVYAVKKGRNTGLYYNWPECQAQVHGYSGAIFRKFDDEGSALQFLRSDSLSSTEKRSTEKRSIAPSYYNENSFRQTLDQHSSGPFFYGVANGRKVGVFEDWEECMQQVYGYSGAKFRKFTDYDEASDYVEDNFHLRTNFVLSGLVLSTKRGPYYSVKFPNGGKYIFDDWNECRASISGVPNVIYKKFSTKGEAEYFLGLHEIIRRKPDHKIVSEYLQFHNRHALSLQKTRRVTEVYTDGAFFSESGGLGGIGVYFGPNDPRNVSRSVRNATDSYGPEVFALYFALEIISKELDLHVANKTAIFPKYKVITDSQAAASVLDYYGQIWTADEFESRPQGEKLRQILLFYNRIKSYYSDHAVLFNNFEFKIYWTRGHRGTEGNEIADQLARDGALQRR